MKQKKANKNIQELEGGRAESKEVMAFSEGHRILINIPTVQVWPCPWDLGIVGNFGTDFGMGASQFGNVFGG